MTRNLTLATVVLLLAIPILASADVHPNSESGFAPEKAFQVGEIDNVNLFNGNLVLTIPIGNAYPVGGGMSYGLSLVYNSTPWIFQQRTDPISGITYNQAYPEPRSNAGLGWQVALGRLFAPGQTVNDLPVNNSNYWIYQGPDGNEHVFYDSLHEGDSAATAVSYTRDGSYLRMKVVGASREVEFPDGTIHRFDSTGKLTQIRNRFTVDDPLPTNDINLVTIVYTQPWTISDNHGRIQKVYFKTLPQDHGNVDVVDRVELTAFGGTSTATYTFGYTPVTIRRPCPHDEDEDIMLKTVQVQLLTSVTLPDGSSYAMPSSDYVVNVPDSGPVCRTSGSILGLKLPTLGKIEWTYMDYVFPSQSSNRPNRQTRPGVGTRKTLDSSGTTLGQWTYSTTRTPVLKSSPSLGATDVLVVYTPDSAGNVASEDYYGADRGANLSTTDTCSFTPSTAQYTINHAYQYGARATSQYAGVSFKSLDRTIDASTGLASSSRDTAGLQTDYEYDTMGRLTWSMPPVGHGAWTEYVYQTATSTTPAKVIIRRRGNGSKTAGVILPTQLHFDSLGRVWKEQTFLPGSVWGVRETQYNGAGWKSQVSEIYPLNGTPTAWTKYLSYDPFGRPGTVRTPDGQSHDVTFTYYGVRVIERTVNVGTAYNAATGTVTEAAAKTTETYDHHGRLYKVAEPSGAGGADVTTTYAYDAADRLVNVKTISGVTQNRWFNYDGQGFLTSEDHPEKGATGNGKVQYFTYDAMGHPGRMTDGPNDLTYVYDKAERLTDVKETSGLQRNLKHFDYDTAAGWGAGKVAQATRYNYPVLGTAPHTAQISETYTYNGIDGRASKRDTSMTFDGVPSEAFTQSFTWSVMGDVETLNYPACIVGRCPATTSRTVTNGYTNGFLTSVASGGLTYATISYQVNGMVNQVVHANGITDTQAVDASGIRRPGSITSTFGAATRWTTGTYNYDGAGNITKMGTSWFTYDKVSRLTTGTVFTGTTGGGTQKQQTYTFDAFGNLTTVGGSPGRNIPIDAATNRLVTSTDPATLTTYDSAGNLTAWNGAATYDYDAFNQMWRMKSGTEEWLYVYTADNERIWSFKVGSTFSRWTLQDLSGNILREYDNNAGTWTLAEDYLYRGSLQFAAETTAGRRHFHLDHLGTPRLITDSAGNQVAYHVYYPFAEEATAFNQDAERSKFTGHERDLASLTGTGDDLDYMHARHFSPMTARFLSVDPMGGNLHTPQAWNRYAYTIGNPLKYIDVDGMSAIDFCVGTICGGEITVSASWDPSGFLDFLWSSANFTAGVVDATMSNFFFGLGRHSFDDPDFQAGQLVGDGASVAAGAAEAVSGTGGVAVGTAFDLTGAGALVGVPIQIVSTFLTIQGATASALGTVHLMEASRKGGGKTGRKINEKRDAKLRGEIEELKQARDRAPNQTERKKIQKKIDHLNRQRQPSETHWRR
jgi:RHS repeat-associated protein